MIFLDIIVQDPNMQEYFKGQPVLFNNILCVIYGSTKEAGKDYNIKLRPFYANEDAGAGKGIDHIISDTKTLKKVVRPISAKMRYEQREDAYRSEKMLKWPIVSPYKTLTSWIQGKYQIVTESSADQSKALYNSLLKVISYQVSTRTNPELFPQKKI